MRLFLVLLFSLLLYSCKYDVEPPIITVRVNQEENKVLMIVNEFKYVGTFDKDIKKNWELFAKKAVVEKNGGVALEEVEVNFFDVRGNKVSYIKGKIGYLDQRRNRAEISNNVVFTRYDKKTTVFSSRLIWDGNSKTIYNTVQDYTRIISPDVKITGRGLRTTPDIYPFELSEIEAEIE